MQIDTEFTQGFDVVDNRITVVSFRSIAMPADEFAKLCILSARNIRRAQYYYRHRTSSEFTVKNVTVEQCIIHYDIRDLSDPRA